MRPRLLPLLALFWALASIGVDNISAWTWFADPDANAANVPVIRPSV